jgi:predicted dehydrogenase
MSQPSLVDRRAFIRRGAAVGAAAHASYGHLGPGWSSFFYEKGGGSMHMAGYDWAPHAVDLATHERRELKRYATDAQGYVWQQGASHVAECLATGRQPAVSAEHALHVVEIMAAARESQRTGRRVAVKSRFARPVIG